jgi:hypothetical protein
MFVGAVSFILPRALRVWQTVQYRYMTRIPLSLLSFTESETSAPVP